MKNIQLRYSEKDILRNNYLRNSFTRMFNFLLLCSLLFMLTACNTSLYEGLSERQANIMLATLLKHNIEAEKISQGKNGFSILVDEKKILLAIDILNENNLPSEEFKNLGSIFKGDSMMSSGAEESARLSYAISQELSDTISRMDGVLTSRVHIVLGEVDQATNIETKPSAAIFIRHLPTSSITNYVAQLKEMASKSIPRLNEADVSVTLMPVRDEISVPRVQASSFFEVVLKGMGNSPLVFISLLICALGILAFFIKFILSGIKEIKARKTQGKESANKDS